MLGQVHDKPHSGPPVRGRLNLVASSLAATLALQGAVVAGGWVNVNTLLSSAGPTCDRGNRAAPWEVRRDCGRAGRNAGYG
jgi:hypothetical protein